MDAAFRSKIEKKLAEYREWSCSRRLSRCRLIHYVGLDLVGAIEIATSEIEAQIEGLVCDGFYVDWEENNGTLYRRVWEFDCPVPDWPSVFAERPLTLSDGD